MKKLVLLLIVLLSINMHSVAKEGMWLPMLLEKINANDMKSLGLRISPEEIYSVNNSSLKDAIVHFGGGCTAELVSEQGLILTNHHCGYSNIQQHSSIEHNYLEDGFWARNREDELKNPGLQAKILTSMQDVTEEILAEVNENMSEEERNAIIQQQIKSLKKANDNSKFHKVDIKEFYHGNQYIMMIYDVFYDVRLVGAPPSNIGKFGGDTDNWMWPRHTGDFSVFRIYANHENMPADISDENKPYEPRKHLTISLRGVQKGDFTMVFGYPGRTQEYIPACDVEFITEVMNPFKIKLRRQKLDIMGDAMDSDEKIRIQYSSKYASVANGWKKWIGENRGIKRMNAVNTKKMNEKRFAQWSKDNGKNYESILRLAQENKEKMIPYEMAYTYFLEAAHYHDLTRFVNKYTQLVEDSRNKDITDEEFLKSLKKYKAGALKFYKDYNKQVDKDIFIACLEAYYAFPYQQIQNPNFFKQIEKKKGSVEKYVDDIYNKSIFTSEEKLIAILNKANRKVIGKFAKDPMFKYSTSIYKYYYDEIRPEILNFGKKKDSLQRIYMAALLDFNENKYLYPDANSTLRVSYGQVEGYSPKDGVNYLHYTTLEGIMAKENPEIFDYVVMPKLKKLYQEKNYGEYGDIDGSMHVCFIASNHTTGGNSGSPALDAEGNLIGINFDRNWEGTMSDLSYDPDQCRNIMLDIRYCLFIIDKFAEARHLIEEMSIIR